MSQILLVEDDPNLRDSLGDILIHAGYDVMTASQGNEALAVLAEHEPDLVIVDLYMPVMNGWQLLEAMRGDARLQSLRVLVMTSAVGQAPPGVTVIPKPQAVAPFLNAVRSALCA